MKIIYFALLAAVLTSCSSLSKQECESLNWNAAGYKSAMQGHPADTEIIRYKKMCVERHHTTINAEAFSKGYVDGLSEYCTDENLFKKGSSGGAYQGICDNHMNKKALTSYSNGRLLFLENTVTELETDKSDLESKVKSLESQIADLESKLKSCTP